MCLANYDGKPVALTDFQGNVFEGICEYLNVGYCENEYARKENALRIANYVFFESDIYAVECRMNTDGIYGGFSAPYGLLEELNIKDTVDLQEQLLCEENVHVYRMLMCIRAYMNNKDICKYCQPDEVLAILEELSAMEIDDYIMAEVKDLMKLAADMQQR